MKGMLFMCVYVYHNIAVCFCVYMYIMLMTPYLQTYFELEFDVFCRSTFDVLKEAYSTGQCLSLYQGVGTKNFQSFLSQFIYFYSYSFIRNVYLQKRNKKRMDTGANLIVAAAAGACTSLIIQVFLCTTYCVLLSL